MIAGIIVGLILGIGGLLAWQHFCCTVDELGERLFGGEE